MARTPSQHLSALPTGDRLTQRKTMRSLGREKSAQHTVLTQQCSTRGSAPSRTSCSVTRPHHRTGHQGSLEGQAPTCLAPRTTGTMHSGSVAWVLSSMRMERNCILASLGSPAPTQVQQMTSAFWGRHRHQTHTFYFTMAAGLGWDLQCPALHPRSNCVCVAHLCAHVHALSDRVLPCCLFS